MKAGDAVVCSASGTQSREGSREATPEGSQEATPDSRGGGVLAGGSWLMES